MNVLQTASAATALLISLGGGIYAGADALDKKYVPMSEWKDFQWSQLKRELRDIEKDMEGAKFEGNDQYAEALEEEYNDLLELLCRQYPDDRACEY
jgi:hypothetical protein